MSVEQVKAFFDKLKDDAALAQKLKDAHEDYNGNKSDKAAVFEAVVIPVAMSADFHFTLDDFNALVDNSEGEISEDELDAVAGGTLYCGRRIDN